MSLMLDKILLWTERQLPEHRQVWISDLRTEAAHVPKGLARLRFQCSGLLAAFGHLLRFRFGPQKLGQILLGSALILLCLGGLVFAQGIEDDSVRTTFYCVLPLYALAGSLALLNLSLMKRFTVSCSLILGIVWMGLGLELFHSLDAPIVFLRAFTLEAAFIMAGLFIAASYLGWIEEAAHA